MDPWDLKPKKKKKKQYSTKDEQTPDTPSSPFSSGIVSLQIGNPPKLFRLHSDILSQSTLLGSTGHVYTDDDALCVSEISPPIFDLVVRFLYGIPFDTWKHMLVPPAGFYFQVEDSLLPTCEMLCFASKYGVSELEDMLFANIQQAPHIEYQSVLAAAKYVYTYAPQVNARFRTFFLDETRKALADPELSSQTWFAAIFEQGYNGLSKEVFECYRNMYSLPKSTAAQTSEAAVASDIIMPFPSAEQHRDGGAKPQQMTSSENDSGLDDNLLSVASSIGNPDSTDLEGQAPQTAHEGDWSEVCMSEDVGICVNDQSIDPEPEPQLGPVPEEEAEVPWDFGLNPKQKRKRRKEMEASGVLFDASGTPYYPEPVEEVPWDLYLSAKEKRKKMKEMQAQGIVFDEHNQPIPAEPIAELNSELQPTLEFMPDDVHTDIHTERGYLTAQPVLEPSVQERESDKSEAAEGLQPGPGVERNAETDPWVFTGSEKKKRNKKINNGVVTVVEELSLPVDPETETKQDFDWGFWGRTSNEKKKQASLDNIESQTFPKPEEPVKDTPEKCDIWDNFLTTSSKTLKSSKKKKLEKDFIKSLTEQHSEPERVETTKTDDIWGTWGTWATSKECVSEVSSLEESMPKTIVPVEPVFEVVLRYDAENHCERRQYHLRKKSRWTKCSDCTSEVAAMTESVSRTCA